jgi:uncharacterized protein YceK
MERLMRYYSFLLYGCFLFTGCLSINTLKKAKTDRKKETANRVLASYKEPNGNCIVIYTKPNDKSVYKIVAPIDAIIRNYNKAQTINWYNSDTAIGNLKGIFYTEQVHNEKGFQRLICFYNETKYKDANQLQQETGKDQNLVTILKNPVSLPVSLSDSVWENRFIKTKVVGFIFNQEFNLVKNIPIPETYIIAFVPQKRKYTRYLLLPFTAAADGITLPIQLIYYGSLLLLAKTIKF